MNTNIQPVKSLACAAVVIGLLGFSGAGLGGNKATDSHPPEYKVITQEYAFSTARERETRAAIERLEQRIQRLEQALQNQDGETLPRAPADTRAMPRT